MPPGGSQDGPGCVHLQQHDWSSVVAHLYKAKTASVSAEWYCASCFQPTLGFEGSRCSQPGHCIAVNTSCTQALCLACRVQMSPSMLEFTKQAVGAAQHCLRKGHTPGEPPNDPAAQVLAKRRRLTRGCPAPEPQPVPPQTQGFASSQTKDGLPLGLRGLNNLGNTCFMNSVLQAFIHTPLVRSYYLGDGHSHATCTRQTSRPCLSCEMDTLFTSMYSGDRRPFSPVDLLYSWWCQEDRLAEYKQQDAHEFYLSALQALSSAVLSKPPVHPTDGVTRRSPAPSQQTAPMKGQLLHEPQHSLSFADSRLAGTQTSMPPSSVAAAAVSSQQAGPAGSEESLSQGALQQDALSLVEAVFGGLLRSDVRCSVCGHTSTAYDPFLDISLDLRAMAKQGGTAGEGAGEEGVVSGMDAVSSMNEGSPHVAGAGVVHTPVRQRRGPDSGGDGAGRSESCSLGDREWPRLTRRISESSVQDGDHQERGTPEISDVSSLMGIAGDHEGRTRNRTGQTGTQPTGANGGQSKGGRAAGASRLAGNSNQAATAGGTRGHAQALLEPAESQMYLQPGHPATPNPAWASVPDAELDDSMSSPLRPRAGGTRQGHTQPTRHAKVSSSGANSQHQSAAAQHVAACHPPPPPQVPPLPPPLDKAAKKGGKSPGKRPEARVTRCGECYTCLNKHLKKACQRNKALRDAGLPPNSAAAGEDAAPLTEQAAAQPSVPIALGQEFTAMPEQSHCSMQAARAGLLPRPGVPNPHRSPLNHPSPLSPRLTPEPSVSDAGALLTEPEGSMLEEPACSHLALNTVAWPVGQGQGAWEQGGGAAAGKSSKANSGRGNQHQAKTSNAGRAGSGGSQQQDTISLADCLGHFIQEEALHASEAWICSHCKKRQQAVKQMSIRRLPPVLCLHIKRFEHAHGSDRVVRKLQTLLSFPTDMFLDMSPFMTATLLRRRYGAMAQDEPITTPPQTRSQQQQLNESLQAALHPHWEDAGILPQDGFLYSLFAVICHKGDISGGHYIVYVRSCGAWFCCDDAWVTMVDVSEVQKAQAYMLFYTQDKYSDADAGRRPVPAG